MIVGLFHDGEYEEEIVQLERGDLLVIFSDGISEAQNEVGEEFGDHRIIEAVSGAKREPDDVLARLFSRLHAFAGDEPPIDDMTALVLRYDD